MTSEREWGEIRAEVTELIHKQRNQRMILDVLIEDGQEMRTELARLRVQLKTAASALAIAIAIIAWLLEFSRP